MSRGFSSPAQRLKISFVISRRKEIPVRVSKYVDDVSPRAWGAVSDQSQKQKKTGGDSGGRSGDSGSGQKKVAKKGEEIKEELDSLMDEIDEVLEENAEEFVKNYVQRGGE
jgi:ubiquitin-like protein Pup